MVLVSWLGGWNCGRQLGAKVAAEQDKHVYDTSTLRRLVLRSEPKIVHSVVL